MSRTAHGRVPVSSHQRRSRSSADPCPNEMTSTGDARARAVFSSIVHVQSGFKRDLLLFIQGLRLQHLRRLESGSGAGRCGKIQFS